jgi:hypothetical protein
MPWPRPHGRAAATARAFPCHVRRSTRLLPRTTHVRVASGGRPPFSLAVFLSFLSLSRGCRRAFASCAAVWGRGQGLRRPTKRTKRTSWTTRRKKKPQQDHLKVSGRSPPCCVGVGTSGVGVSTGGRRGVKCSCTHTFGPHRRRHLEAAGSWGNMALRRRSHPTPLHCYRSHRSLRALPRPPPRVQHPPHRPQAPSACANPWCSVHCRRSTAPPSSWCAYPVPWSGPPP